VHDGIEPVPGAVEALRAFRAGGGRVVLLTNAPRPRLSVADQIDRIGVPRDSWDSIATSGDSARAAMFRGAAGRRVHHVGGSHDEPFFEPLRLVRDAVAIERVPLDEAEGIVCTGPRDPRQPPEAMRETFEQAVARGLPLLCANPDIVVDRGSEREWCAGALAELYTALGGRSLYFGKPHPPIYALARERLLEAGGAPSDRILAIGDGIATDIAGAEEAGIDSVFITGGLARRETMTDTSPEPQALAEFLRAHDAAPTFALGSLR
jgi:HAD superfamily hydrolase (TIGR01459 family)